MAGKATQRNGQRYIIVGCLVIIVVLIIIVVLLLTGGQSSNQTVEKPKRDVVVNANNVESTVNEMLEEEYVAPGTYRVTMNSTWKFESSGVASSNAYVENSTANTNAVYFDVQLEDTEEVIYQSPVIPVGSYLDNIVLDKALAKGSYDCVLIYHLVDDEQETISTLRMAITIVVEN